MKDTVKNRNRNWTLLLYPQEDETHSEVIEYIKKNYEYAMINHNKDVNEDGELKKEHIHLVFRTGQNARWRSAVAEELGLNLAYIEGCNLNKQLLYLIHKENPDKYQYSIDEVQGNLKNKLVELLEKDKTDSENATKLLSYILETTNVNIISLTEFALENGIYGTLKKSSYLFNKLIEEKNRRRKWQTKI